MAVAEPGEKATEFLQNVINGMRLGSTGKARVPLPRISNLADLVAGFPRFSVSGTLYRFMGRHTQVSSPDQFILGLANLDAFGSIEFEFWRKRDGKWPCVYNHVWQ